MNQPVYKSPIFLLGTGRCGSTYLQRLLCSTKDVWICGEHDGLLTCLSGIFKQLSPDSPLSKWNFDRGPSLGKLDLSSFGERDATALAWASGFDRENLKRAIVDFVFQLFSANLPEGKERWGFKEIRYGPESGVAEMLLELFPYSKIVITARRGNDTIISAIASWHYDAVTEFLENGSDARLMQCFNSLATRWISFSNYFADLVGSFPKRVVISRLESPESLGSIFEFLGIDLTAELQDLSKQRVNTNKKTGTNDARVLAKLQELAKPYQTEIRNVELRLGY